MSVMQTSPRPSTVVERRPTISTGCVTTYTQPSLVLPISTRETRTASIVSASSLVSSSPPAARKSTTSSSMGFSASRRRTSSVVSVMYPPRKETWANIQTPESHWHPSGVAGLSFGVGPIPVEVSESQPMRRRSSSLLSTRGLSGGASASMQVPATIAQTQPAQAPAQQTQVSLAYPAPYVQSVQQQLVTSPLPSQPPLQPPSQPAPMVFEAASTTVPQAAAAPPQAVPQVVQTTTSPTMIVPNQAVQMQYGGYMQAAPGGGYVILGVMPGAPMQASAQQLQAQAQPIKLSSLISEQQTMISPVVGASVQVGVMNGREPVTTVMLRNIPQKYDRETLIDVLNKTGFAGTFDFFYLPIDFSTTNSVGYAFINFINEAELARFRAAYVGKKLSEESPKVCEVCDAKLQGKAKNVDFYRNSTVMGMDEKYHPVLYENGARVVFPKPTRPIGPVQRRPPRTHPKQQY